MCAQSTAQSPEHPWLPALRANSARAEASPWDPSLCGAVQWALKGSQCQPSSQSGSTECRKDRECAISLQGVTVTVPGQSKAQCLPWERPSSRALHSSLLWEQEEIINSHVSGNVCFLASLFSLQGRKRCSPAHSQHLPSQNLFYMQGLEHWVRDQGRIKATVPILQRAPPAGEALPARDIESGGRGNTKAAMRNTSNPTNFTQACL